MSNFYKLVLKNPCNTSYPKGTKIREHLTGDARIYNIVCGEILATSTNRLDNFKKFNNLITTYNSSLMLEKLYPKTRYVRLYIRVKCQMPNAILLFKNIKMETIEQNSMK